jgi:hypothetical protein
MKKRKQSTKFRVELKVGKMNFSTKFLRLTCIALCPVIMLSRFSPANKVIL